MADVTNESGLREKIARVIDPEAFESVADEPRIVQVRAGTRQRAAIDKADAILALISPAGEVSGADALLREVFSGKVQVAFAGNPNVCDDLERRVHKYLSAAPRGMEG